MRRELDVEHQIVLVTHRVAAASKGAVAVEQIEAEVRRCFDEWADASVRDFLPIFAERHVRELIAKTAPQALTGS